MTLGFRGSSRFFSITSGCLGDSASTFSFLTSGLSLLPSSSRRSTGSLSFFTSGLSDLGGGLKWGTRLLSALESSLKGDLSLAQRQRVLRQVLGKLGLGFVLLYHTAFSALALELSCPVVACRLL